MGEATEAKPEKVETGLRPWVIATAIIMPPLAFFLNNWMQSLSRWWLYPALLPLPFFWFLVIFYIIERLTKKKFTPQELALFLTICYMLGGQVYGFCGIQQWTSVPMVTNSWLYWLYGACVDPYKEVFAKLPPHYIIPRVEAALRAFYYGGAFDFGAWAPSIFFWMFGAIIFYSMVYFAELWIVDPMVRVERFPFPNIMPSLLQVKYYTEETNGVKTLFNIKSPTGKFFWIGFILGGLISAPLIIKSFMPVPWISYIHWVPWDLRPITRSFLPGANIRGVLRIPNIFLWLFVPFDVMYTYLLWSVITCIIYPVIGVRLGVLPYSPGIEGAYGWTVGPFKYQWFGQLGVSFGLGLWVIYNYRSHIIGIIRRGLRGEPGEPGSLPPRLILLGTLGSIILMIILLNLAYVDPVLSVILPFFYLAFMFGWARFQAEWYGSGGYPALGRYTGAIFDIGTALGRWGGRPDPKAFFTIAGYQTLFGFSERVMAMAMHNHIMVYKIADETRTPFRSIFIISMIVAVTTAIAGFIIWPWWYTIIGGYSRARAICYGQWRIGSIWSLTYGTPPALGVAETWGMIVSGTVVTFICGLLRARFPWFFINPVAFIAYPGGYWSHCLIGLAIKYFTVRIGGTRALERYVIPFGVGFMIGYGAIAAGIFSWVDFFTVGLPEFMARMRA